MTLDALDRQFDQSFDALMSTYQEGVLDIPMQIGEFIRRAIILVDEYAISIKWILDQKMLQLEYKKYLKAIEEHKEYFEKQPAWTRYSKTLADKNIDYAFSVMNGVCKLMADETKYEWLDPYVKKYIDEVMNSTNPSTNTIILELRYENIYKWVMEWKKYSDDRIQTVLDAMKNFRFMWEKTKTGKLSQTLIGGLLKSCKTAIRTHAIATIYNMNAFKIATSNLVKDAITKEEITCRRNMMKISPRDRTKLEKKATIIKTYLFGDMKVNVYELPIKYIDSAYNRDGTKIYVDQSFKEYPRAVQKAIIYHEIGHLSQGHFGAVDEQNDSIDARKMANKIKLFKRLVAKSPFKEAYTDDDLIYILIESEADEFAAQHVGKRTIGNSLKIRLNRDLYSVIPKKQGTITDQEALLIAYNQELLRFRESLVFA